jgi:hypothetical protein
MRYILALTVLLCLSFAGCGDGTRKIQGKITFPDGSPLTTGTVVFASSQFTEKSTLNSDGQFSLAVPSGNYKVYIALAAKLDETFVPPPNEPDAVRYVELIHSSFASLSETPLTCDVSKSGEQNFTVEPPM